MQLLDGKWVDTIQETVQHGHNIIIKKNRYRVAVPKVVVGIVHVPRDKCPVILTAAVQALYFVTGAAFLFEIKDDAGSEDD